MTKRARKTTAKRTSVTPEMEPTQEPAAAAPPAPPDDGLEADVAAIRARLRLNREADNQRKIAAREGLRAGLADLSLKALVERAVQLTEECDRLRAENHEWRNTRDKNGEKIWRSQYAYLDAVATELDSQRARCEELQAQLSAFAHDRHADQGRMNDEMVQLIQEEKSRFAGAEREYAAALAAETNKRERLELNLVTVLESLQVVGVTSARVPRRAPQGEPASTMNGLTYGMDYTPPAQVR
jgi:hypothetical protein